jgi:DNA-binding transcriptional MerR regulator
MKQLANNSAAADHLGIAAATLQYWRTTGAQKIPFIKVGGRVMYRISDLDDWLTANTFSHTGEYSINK